MATRSRSTPSHTCTALVVCALATALPLRAQSSAIAPTTMAAPTTAAAPTPASTPSLSTIRVAVYQLQGREVSERVAAIVTDSLVSELRKLERLSVIGMDEVADMLTHEENKQMLGCDDESCLAEIAGALGVDELVTGSLGRVGGSSAVNLRRIDMQAARVVTTVDERLEAGSGEEFLAVLGPAVARLYPEHPLRPGTERGVPAEVALQLDPPPLPTWIFWATSGTALALALGSVGATVMAGLRTDTYNTLAASSVPPGEPVDATELDALRSEVGIWDVTRWSLLGSAGVLVIAAGFEAIFTDWEGYGDQE